MFIDQKILRVEAGKGGNGATLFRREKYVPYGGPDGGDGGNGGAVIVTAQHDLHALNHLAHTKEVKAEDGQAGAGQRKTGHNGQEVILKLPLGTLIEEELTPGEWTTITELTHDKDQLILVKGGSGGWGNWHFKSSVNQAPTRHNDGLPGESKTIRLTLKLIADVGLVGLPNAGKSTFLAAVTAAQPKIAAYPFTTLEPQLGVAQVRFGKESKSLVIADLPGLIEGAHTGKGLGITFLKHIERTKTILHLLDASLSPDEVTKAYLTVREELKTWSDVLADKPEIVVLTKIELVSPAQINQIKKKLKPHCQNIEAISAASHIGLEPLLKHLVANS